MNHLAEYAARETDSRGRIYPEPAPGLRSQYQRDRDRIIHSSAFRRLEYKTQVFVNHEGDMFRTRLTHSLEVSQIGRTVARALSLNEDLTEAICLAHDLGHTPFGHAGQEELNACMKEYGGFEHNLQSLRVVDKLEQKYAAFPGLNLTFETREGILKHCSLNNARKLGELGERFLRRLQPGLEAQIANIADEIAYNNHDIDDGLRAGLLTMEQLYDCSLFKEQYDLVRKAWPSLPAKRTRHELIRRMINKVVVDLVDTSALRIRKRTPAGIDDVRHAGSVLVALSEEVERQHRQLKQFLRDHLYRHQRVRQMSDRAKETIRILFDAYLSGSAGLPEELEERLAGKGRDAEQEPAARIIADYIAGMTDRYAFAESARIRCGGKPGDESG